MAQKWRIKANEGKSIHITFTNRKEHCPIVKLNNMPLAQSETVKYLGIHLDRRLNWRKHILSKSKQLRLKFNKLYWLMGRSSQTSLECKIAIYKSILRPIWTYGIELWGSASNSNIEILERFQAKVLRSIVNAPWYVRNDRIRKDLDISSVKEMILSRSLKYNSRLMEHPNQLVPQLLNTNGQTRRLKRYQPADLISRFTNQR